jgi:hypothetical protein
MEARFLVSNQFLCAALMQTAATKITLRQQGIWTTFCFPNGDELLMTTLENAKDIQHLNFTKRMINFMNTVKNSSGLVSAF